MENAGLNTVQVRRSHLKGGALFREDLSVRVWRELFSFVVEVAGYVVFSADIK